MLPTVPPMRIAIFYHCLFFMGEPPELIDKAVAVVHEQMAALKLSGLEDAAEEIHIGINGGEESQLLRELLPVKAQITYHGLQSKAENLTIVLLENWLKTHPDWYVLYTHAKGSTHAIGSPYGQYSDNWRQAMMWHLVTHWRQCVADLDAGHEACGCNWLTGMGWDKSQNIFGGNFWWAKSSYLRILPSIFERQRIKDSGIAAAESRYESEVWIGNGPRLPVVKVYHPGGM